jgi:hypothetical protein
MPFLLALTLIILVIMFRGKIVAFLYGRLKSRHPTDLTALSFTLGNILTELTDRERILFRDNIDKVFKAFRSRHFYLRECDVCFITEAYARIAPSVSLADEPKAAIVKVFEIIAKTATKAPSNLRRELTVDEIYIFLKENI